MERATFTATAEGAAHVTPRTAAARRARTRRAGWVVLLAVAGFGGCDAPDAIRGTPARPGTDGSVAMAPPHSGRAEAPAASAGPSPVPLSGAPDARGAPTRSAREARRQARDTAVFAGGCFWCMEPPYDELDGVLSTTSGYAGGHVPDPTYDQVTAGGTGHREAVRIVYDPAAVSYERLLEVFWGNVDPLDDGGQFCDRGFSYTTAVFATDEAQARMARASKRQIQERLEREVVTPVVTDWRFWPAEDFHQDHYQKNPVRYEFYRWRCGRDDRLEELWGGGRPSG